MGMRSAAHQRITIGINMDIDNEYGKQFEGYLLAGILNQMTDEARKEAFKNPYVETFVISEIVSKMHRKPYLVLDALKCKLKKEYNKEKIGALLWHINQNPTFEEMLNAAIMHGMEKIK